MLGFKAWRETRARFLLSVVALVWFCGAFVVLRPAIQYAARRPFQEFVIDAIYTGAVRNIFVLFIIALGLGGLAQEVSRGSVAFTLALPVTRARIVMARACVGLLEVVTLALVPTIVIVGLSRLVGETFNVAEAGLYSIQWAATGSVLFAVAFLLSVWLTGAYAALTASFLVLAVYVSILNVPALRAVPALNVFALMDRAHPSPARLVGAFMVAFAVISAATWATERQDF
jgi:ABC-type transport system involved in multi-copper enzyme maturation permease subunit